jgi:hypothetical protein
MENNYLCGENIRFAMITDKLSNKLKGVVVKKFHLVNEAQVIEKIEEAVMAYYNITLEDTSIEEDVNYDSYVYIYADPRKKGNWHVYGKEYIEFKPLYIGKGSGDRAEAHLRYSCNSELDNTIKVLKNLNISPIVKIYNKGCTSLMAHNLENYIIARLREQGVDLCNATFQTDAEQYRKNKDFIITTLNLEKAEGMLIVDALNSTRRRKEAAEALGVSERTLYRKINSLNISESRGVYFFTDNKARGLYGTVIETRKSRIKKS